MATVSAPGNVPFAGFYYGEILRELLDDLRFRRDELGLTDENDFEVHVQFLRSFALVGHLNNTRLDTVASELLFGTAKLLESLKRLLRFIGVELSSATPAVADVLLELSEVTTSDVADFIPELAEFATAGTPPIAFEVLQEGGLPLDRTDRVSHVYGLEEIKTGSAGFVDTAAPDVFNRTTGTPFAADNVGDHLFVPRGISANGGEFRVVEFINTNQVRLVRVPGSDSPAFQTETGLDWSLKRFTPDYANEANTDLSTFSPWLDPVEGDLLYVGHKHMLANQLDVENISAAASGITGVFEYYDDRNSVFSPSTVTDNGSTITFGVNSLLGTVDRHGAAVVVRHLATGQQEVVESEWSSGVNRITTSGILGQVTVSTDLDDYSITADWIPMPNQADGSSDFTGDGSITFDLPQDDERNWQATEVNLDDAYWIRYRILSISAPLPPTFDRLRLDQGDQYMVVVATQGETVGPQILGSSDGSANQEFLLPDTPYLDDTAVVEVDETGGGNWAAYTEVANFLNSTSTSRHYRLEKDAEDKATAIFGDGVNGKVPPAGTDNVRAAYRVGGDLSGNVGIDEIVNNADGVPGVGTVTNPRPAEGWRMKDGGTDSDIVRIKRDKPAELRTRGTASNAGDVVLLAINSFVDRYGTKPVARAYAIEGGLGLKTVKLMVVGTGGTTLTSQQKDDLEEYFNGDRYARPPVYGALTLNQQVGVFNFQPKQITVQATVRWPGGSGERVRNALLNLLTPLALEDDGVTYVFDFGGSVSQSRVYSEIHAVDPAITDVPSLLLNGSDASVELGDNELPASTAASITISIQG